MEHIGIDLGSCESQVCIRNGAGDIVEELRCRTDRLVPWLARRARARVVVETCTARADCDSKVLIVKDRFTVLCCDQRGTVSPLKTCWIHRLMNRRVFGIGFELWTSA
jgi:hypothetical protein